MSIKSATLPTLCTAVATVAAGCAPTSVLTEGPVQGTPAQLSGRTFEWTNGITETEGEFPHIAFDGTGSVSGLAGCNNLLGQVHQKGLEVDFSSLGTTRMLCAPKVMQSERAFLALLREATYATQSLETDGAVVLWNKAGVRLGELRPKKD